MPPSRLDVVASTFKTHSEALHDKFLAMRADIACSGCKSSGFGEAILVAWLQTKWTEFTRSLVIASALGTRRTTGSSVQAVAGIKSLADANRLVKDASACVSERRGVGTPIWHVPGFVIEVSDLMGLRNLSRIEAALSPTNIPGQITDFRNYLVHPGNRTRSKYETLQAKLGMNRMEPEDLPHQQQNPGLPIFTWWVSELQSVAYDSTR